MISTQDKIFLTYPMTNKPNFLLHFLCVYSIISIYHFINTVFIVSTHLPH